MELKVRPKETDDSQVPKKVLNETIQSFNPQQMGGLAEILATLLERTNCKQFVS